MGTRPALLLPLLCATLLLLQSVAESDPSHRVFIVYLGAKSSKPESEIVREHHDLLASVMGSGNEDAILYHYHKAFRGFAAKMGFHHAEALKRSEQVHSVFESKSHAPHTTHSWEFLNIRGPNNLTAGPYQFPPFESQHDVIIGVLDSGFWPESPSYFGLDLPPPPLRWTGQCIPGPNFTADLCSNKVIGARAFYQGALATALQLGLVLDQFDILSPRDVGGHGTHTSSTAAGRVVPGVSYFGIAGGDLSGGAPGARLAIYKVCWEPPINCPEADILAGFDAAISDGVDLISLSVGSGDSEQTHFQDAIAIGSYHATRNNILVSASAGNNGTQLATIGNTAPWILTVAASSNDRFLATNLQLGDGTIIPGGWVANPFNALPQPAPFVPASLAPSFAATPDQASYCLSGSLDATLLAGAIVACLLDSPKDAEAEAIRVNAAGIVFVGNGTVSDQFSLPVTFITQEAAALTDPYFRSTAMPVANILPTVAMYNNTPAPVVTAFSSRGPSNRNPNIIKPDITGPGQDILAAYSPLSTGSTGGRSVNFNFLSGTSMSCPHITGIAALIKVVHPDWSPAAIKSAIMTTAYQKDNLGNPIGRMGQDAAAGPFDFGSGHVLPASALNPGLVYDTDPNEYIDFLCNFGITDLQLQQFTGIPAITCPLTPVRQYDLNYPSIGVANLVGTQTIHRTVTNVGPVGLVTYTLSLESLESNGVSVTVDPPVLNFQTVGQKLSYSVTFNVVTPIVGVWYIWGSLTWSDGIHIVRSPMQVTTRY